MALLGLIFIVFGIAFYFLPSIVGRNKSNSGAIFVLNLLLGWTLVGWVVALVWALTVETQSPNTPVYVQSTPIASALPIPAAYCAKCGNGLIAGSRFCSQCGFSSVALPNGMASHSGPTIQL